MLVDVERQTVSVEMQVQVLVVDLWLWKSTKAQRHSMRRQRATLSPKNMTVNHAFNVNVVVFACRQYVHVY